MENRVAGEKPYESPLPHQGLGEGGLPGTDRSRKQDNTPAAISGIHRDALCKRDVEGVSGLAVRQPVSARTVPWDLNQVGRAFVNR
jgi:hypothetical protein